MYPKHNRHHKEFKEGELVTFLPGTLGTEETEPHRTCMHMLGPENIGIYLEKKEINSRLGLQPALIATLHKVLVGEVIVWVANKTLLEAKK